MKHPNDRIIVDFDTHARRVMRVEHSKSTKAHFQVCVLCTPRNAIEFSSQRRIFIYKLYDESSLIYFFRFPLLIVPLLNK